MIATNEVTSQLDRLARAQLIRRLDVAEETYSFKHALTQDAAYQSLLNKKRIEIHRQVALAYERFYPDNLDDYAALLAYHYGEAGDESKTIEYARRAGDVAVRVNAYTEALAYYSRALAMAERGPVNLFVLSELYLRQGRVRELSGHYGAARAVYERMEALALEHGDQAMELAALMARTTIHAIPTTEFNFPLAKELAARSLKLARDLKDRPAEAKILWNIMLMHSRYHLNSGRALEAGEESIAIARALDLREQLAYSLNDIVIVYFYGGRPDLGEAALLEARTLWQESGNLPMLTDNLNYAVMGHSAQGKFEQSIAEAEQAKELSIKIGSLWGEAFSGMWIGPAWLEIGRPDRACSVMQAAIALAEPSGFLGPLGVTRADLGRLYGEFGQIAHGLELTRQAIKGLPSLASAPGAYAAGDLAFLLILQGDLDEAERVIAAADQAVDAESAKGRMTIELRYAKGELALARSDLAGAVHAFGQLADNLSRMELHALLPLTLRGQARALHLLGKSDEAVVGLEKALAVAERLGARWSQWKILATLADVTEARDASRARDLRAQAREIVREILTHTPDDLRTTFLKTPAALALYEN